MGQSPNGKNYTDNPNDYILIQGNADMKNGKVAPRVWTTQVTKTADPKDIILSVRAPVGDVGKTDFHAVLGRGVAGIKGNEFLYQALVWMKMFGYWTKVSTGSTFESINSTDLKNAIISCPGNNEQRRIGEFLNHLDKAVELHQRKLDRLTNLKKAILQLMFPEKNHSAPKLRFNNFSEVWEQRKLGKICNTYSGGTPSVTDSSYYNGNIPFIRSAEINSETTELFLTKSGLKNSSAKLVEKGSILYAMYGATSGEVGISKINGAINQAILAIHPHENYNSYFIMQWLRLNKEQIISTYLQGGQGNLSGSIIKSLKIEFPNSNEQQIIGDFFNLLDKNIALHQRKLDTLIELKNTYLQLLFV